MKGRWATNGHYHLEISMNEAELAVLHRLSEARTMLEDLCTEGG